MRIFNLFNIHRNFSPRNIFFNLRMFAFVIEFVVRISNFKDDTGVSSRAETSRGCKFSRRTACTLGVLDGRENAGVLRAIVISYRSAVHLSSLSLFFSFTFSSRIYSSRTYVPRLSRRGQDRRGTFVGIWASKFSGRTVAKGAWDVLGRLYDAGVKGEPTWWPTFHIVAAHRRLSLRVMQAITGCHRRIPPRPISNKWFYF